MILGHIVICKHGSLSLLMKTPFTKTKGKKEKKSLWHSFDNYIYINNYLIVLVHILLEQTLISMDVSNYLNDTDSRI